MRALLGLMIVVLISGCAARLPANSGSCNERGMNYMAETKQCIPRAKTNLSTAYRSNHYIAEPIIDKGTPSFDYGKYATDLTACRGYANQVAGQGVDGALGGAVVGALFGAIVDSSLGTSGGARTGAMSGALGGGVRGVANTHQGRALVVRKCLAGRGYSVLDM